MKIIATSIIASMLLLITAKAGAQHFQYADTAFQKAAAEKRDLILFFSGSDWCTHCLRFEKTILKDPLFDAYAQDHLVILHADFPQRKKLPDQLVKQNEQLSEKYNPRGLFPTLLIFARDTSKYIYLDYKNQRVEIFLEQVKEKTATLTTGE